MKVVSLITYLGLVAVTATTWVGAVPPEEPSLLRGQNRTLHMERRLTTPVVNDNYIEITMSNDHVHAGSRAPNIIMRFGSLDDGDKKDLHQATGHRMVLQTANIWKTGLYRWVVWFLLRMSTTENTAFGLVITFALEQGTAASSSITLTRPVPLDQAQESRPSRALVVVLVHMQSVFTTNELLVASIPLEMHTRVGGSVYI